VEKIVSFGYKHGIPMQHTNHVVVDVRKMFRNPHVHPFLRERTGLDAEVGRYIESTRNFDLLYQHVKEQVTVPGTRVAYVGCIGGQHRSVYLVNRLGKELGVRVEHRDLNS
jgi:RNase adapter protein RapZ